jgi:DNA-binding SARP family transcriptional activator
MPATSPALLDDIRPATPLLAQLHEARIIPFPRAAVRPEPPAAPVTAPDPDSSIDLNLLGGFGLAVDHQPVSVGLTGQRLLSLLACLGRPVSRSRAAFLLWPDTAEARAQSNLRTAVYRLQRACRGALESTGPHVGLGASVRVDVAAIRQVAGDILGLGQLPDNSDAVVADALRLNLYEDLLPDWQDDWLRDDQYRHRQLRLDTLEVLAQRLADSGRHREAFHIALAAVQADPLRDSAYETLIRSCLARGNRNDAMNAYHTYRRIMRDELGLDPSRTIDELLVERRATA